MTEGKMVENLSEGSGEGQISKKEEFGEHAHM
jgi:hypothetical protein